MRLYLVPYLAKVFLCSDKLIEANSVRQLWYISCLHNSYSFISHILLHSHVFTRVKQKEYFYVLEIQDKYQSRTYNWSLLENMAQSYVNIFKCMKYQTLWKTLAFHLRWRFWTICNIWNITFLVWDHFLRDQSLLTFLSIFSGLIRTFISTKKNSKKFDSTAKETISPRDRTITQ